MSVYIKGMEMPKEGTFNIICIYSDGHVSMPSWGKGLRIVQGINAVSVPAHGRLIDADALPSKDVYDQNWHEYGYSQYVIDAAPTIIPAEEGE